MSFFSSSVISLTFRGPPKLTAWICATSAKLPATPNVPSSYNGRLHNSHLPAAIPQSVSLTESLIAVRATSDEFFRGIPLYSPKTDIVIHQKIRIFLNCLLGQAVCDINDSLIVFVLPKPGETNADSFRAEQL